MQKRQRGVAIIEFALILPLMLVMTFVTTEFGRAIWQYNTLTKSVRDAARYLSTQPETAENIDKARNLMVFGSLNPGSGDSTLALGLDLDNVPAASCCTWQDVTTTPVNGSSITIKTVTVRISGYQFTSMFSSVFGLPFGTINYSNITATMRTFQS